MAELHPTIRHLAMPRRIATLPLTENGFPVLYFADEVDGKPDLRVMDGRKLVKCIKEKRCWLCGQSLGRNMAFVVGPMCCVTRTSSEPPSHYECAEYSVKACPFLTRPKARRREIGVEEASMAGIGLKRNPGVSAIWITRSYKTFRASGGAGVLITMGDPEGVEWWAEARQATYSEVCESIEGGAPELMKLAHTDKVAGATRDLAERFAGILPLLRGLPGRDERKPERLGMNEAVLIAARADEIAWFALHPDETEYVRSVYPGEYPPDISPTHAMVRKLDPVAHTRSREFGRVVSGEFVSLGG